MIEVTRTQLLPGVHLTAVQTQKFKSSVLGMQFLLPLAREQAALHALLPMVLRRGTAEHPDMESLSAVLDELYGGSLEPTVRKKGETQCVGFVGSFLDDAYTLDGSAVLEPSAALLGELVLRPYTRDEVFCPDYTRQERENLVTRIRAQVNDKRQYAQVRVVAEMCAGEPFGVDKLGDEASAAAITPQKLWDCYQQVLRTAPIEFYYCGSAPLERVRAAVQAIVDGLPAGERAPLARPEKGNAPAQPRRVEEALDLADVIIFMDHGRIVQMAPPEEMLAHPASGLIQDFLGKFINTPSHKALTAADFMRTGVYTVSLHRGTNECVRKMQRYNVDTLIVVDDAGRYAGTVSIADIRLNGHVVTDIAPLVRTATPTVHSGDDAKGCFEQLISSGASYLVVLGEAEQVEGIITKTSMASAMAEQLWG